MRMLKVQGRVSKSEISKEFCPFDLLKTFPWDSYVEKLLKLG